MSMFDFPKRMILPHPHSWRTQNSFRTLKTRLVALMEHMLIVSHLQMNVLGHVIAKGVCRRIALHAVILRCAFNILSVATRAL